MVAPAPDDSLISNEESHNTPQNPHDSNMAASKASIKPSESSDVFEELLSVRCLAVTARNKKIYKICFLSNLNVLILPLKILFIFVLFLVDSSRRAFFVDFF